MVWEERRGYGCYVENGVNMDGVGAVEGIWMLWVRWRE